METEDERTHVTTHYHGSVCVLAVQGELTSSAEEPLSNAYMAATAVGNCRVLLDFHRASTINSAGVALIMRIATDCDRHKHVLAFSGLDSHFDTLFHMAGLTQYGAIYVTETEALAALDT